MAEHEDAPIDYEHITWPEETLDEAADILAERFRENPISSRELGLRLGLGEKDTSRLTRHLIVALLRARRLPIGACAEGYFWLSDPGEVRGYVADLRRRAAAIQERADLVEENFAHPEWWHVEPSPPRNVPEEP